MMADFISMKPEELEAAAAFILGKQEEMASATEALKNKVDATTAEWAGAAQNQFVQNFNDLLPVLTETLPQVLEGLQSMFNGAASDLREADELIAQRLGR